MESHQYFHNHEDSEDRADDDNHYNDEDDGDDKDDEDDDNGDQEEGSSAYAYSTSVGYTSANCSIKDNVPVEFSEYRSREDSDWNLESLMETFVAFGGVEFR